jgi:hypothetical protein
LRQLLQPGDTGLTNGIPEKGDDVTKHALFEVLKTAVNHLTKPK